MQKPIVSLYRGARTWMVSRDVPEVEGGWFSRRTSTPFLSEVDVEFALEKVQAELPGHDVRVLNWYRPKGDYLSPG